MGGGEGRDEMEWIGPELLLWVQPALSALLSPVPRARRVSELSDGLGSSASCQRPGMTTEYTAMPASTIDTPDVTAVQINERITFFLSLSLTRVSPGLAARPTAQLLVSLHVYISYCHKEPL